MVHGQAAIQDDPLLISRMLGMGRERRDEAADVDRDNGRRNTGRVTTR